MSKQNLFVFVKIYQGVLDGVELHRTEITAERSYRKYVGQPYPKTKDGFDEIHEDYADCSIQVTRLPRWLQIKEA